MTDIEKNQLYRYSLMNVELESLNAINEMISHPSTKITELPNFNEKMFSKDILKVLALTTNFVIKKEESIETIKDKYNYKINSDLIEKLIKKIAGEYHSDGSFVIGKKKFNNSIELFNTLRNKFAHGAYKYDDVNREICLLIDGNTLPIPLDWLEKFNNLIFNNVDESSKEGTYYNCIVKTSKNGFMKINNIRDYMNEAKKTYTHEFTINKQNYSTSSLKLVTYLLQLICEKIKNSQYIGQDIKDVETFCRLNNLDFKYKIIPFTNYTKEQKKKVEDAYYHVEDFASLNKSPQSFLLSQYIADARTNKGSTDQLNEGIFFLFDFLDCVDLNKSLAESVKDNKVPFTRYHRFVPAFYFLTFISLFSYNNEEIFEENLEYEKLYMPKFKIDKNKFEELELEKLNNKIENLEAKLRGLINKKEGIISSHKEKQKALKKYKPTELDKFNKSTLVRIKPIIKDIVDTHESLRVLRNERNTYLEKIKNNKLRYENKNILGHIRNCICHGNFTIEVDPKKRSLDGYKIHLTDIYKGENTFDATLTLLDFGYLISKGNINKINNMFRKLLEPAIIEEEKQKQKKLGGLNDETR